MTDLALERLLGEAGVSNLVPFSGMRAPFPLRDYQTEALHGELYWSRYGLYLEPRLGKTAVFLLTAIYCATYDVGSIILMPPILLRQTMREFAKFNTLGRVEAAVFAGTIKQREAMLAKWKRGPRPGILFMTKEIFLKTWPMLMALQYKRLVWDECHLGLQSSESKIYEAVKMFLSSSDSRGTFSTGTPIYGSPANAYPLISLVNPNAYVNESDFLRRHVLMKPITVKTKRGKDATIEIPDKILSTEYLTQNMFSVNTIKRTRVGTMNMAVPDIGITEIELSPAHYRAYAEFVKMRVLEVQKETGTELIAARSASKLRELASAIVHSPQHYTSLERKDNALLTAVEAIIDEYPTNERVVIVASHRQAVETLAEHFAKYEPAVIYGGNSPSKNAAEADRFIDDTTFCKLCILNAQAGGVGLRFGDHCSVMIFYEPVVVYGLFDQVLSRLMLVEKQRPVSAYVLKPAATVYAKAITNMLAKVNTITEVDVTAGELLRELLGEDQ